MKRTKIFAAFAVISAIMATIIVSSCSSEYTEEETNKGSMSQEDKIQKLAEEYGLQFVGNIGWIQSMTRADLDGLFLSASNVAGDYYLVGESHADSAYVTAFQRDMLYSPLVRPEMPETGTGSLTGNGDNITVKIEFTWDLVNHQSCSMNVSEINYEYDRCNIDECMFLGADSNVISFAFSCYKKLVGDCTEIVHASGSYNISTSTGSMDITRIIKGDGSD